MRVLVAPQQGMFCTGFRHLDLAGQKLYPQETSRASRRPCACKRYPKRENATPQQVCTPTEISKGSRSVPLEREMESGECAAIEASYFTRWRLCDDACGGGGGWLYPSFPPVRPRQDPWTAYDAEWVISFKRIKQSSVRTCHPRKPTFRNMMQNQLHPGISCSVAHARVALHVSPGP